MPATGALAWATGDPIVTLVVTDKEGVSRSNIATVRAEITLFFDGSVNDFLTEAMDALLIVR